MAEKDLIRRVDVLNLAKHIVFTDDEGRPVFKHICVNLDHVRSIPAVDAVEVRHGHWVTEEEAIEKDDYSLRDTCSECGHCDWDCTESKDFNFCPNCGAKMDDVYQPPICGPGEEDGDGCTDT